MGDYDTTEVELIMAIQNQPLGQFRPFAEQIQYEIVIADKSASNRANKRKYIYDCRLKNQDPSVIVKWCRRNFGERGSGWDFFLLSGSVTIEIWNEKYMTMYEMRHL